MWQIPRRSPDAAWASQLIRQARARLGFDHVWAAQLLGVTPGYLFMVETGMPEQEAAELLAAASAVDEKGRAWQRA